MLRVLFRLALGFSGILAVHWWFVSLKSEESDIPFVALEQSRGGQSSTAEEFSAPLGLPNRYQRRPLGSNFPSAMSARSAAMQSFFLERHVVVPVSNLLPIQVVVGDVTGDRIPDIVVTMDGLHVLYLRIHAQNIDGTLAAPIDFQLPMISSNGGGLELVDLDGDGGLEIAVGIGNGVTVFKRSGGTYEQRSFIGNVRALSLGAVDLDGDGYRDLFVQAAYEGADLYLSDRRGGFKSIQRLPTPLAGYNTLEISDFTADGIADVVMTNGQGWPVVVVYPTVASGGLLSPIELDLRPFKAWPSFGVTVSDIDRDGRPDVVVTDEGVGPLPEARGIHIYYRGSGNEFARHQLLSFTGYYERPGAVQVADIDHNGYPDIVAMINSNDQMVYVLQGPAGFAAPVFQATDDNPWTNNFYRDNSFVIADVNSDNCPDIVLAELSSSLRVFYGRNCLVPPRRTGGPSVPRKG